jgi:hypothetical protein
MTFVIWSLGVVFEQFKNRGEICSAANTINLKNATQFLTLK